MKKVSFVALALVAMLSVASCKSDKCKCTYETKLFKPQEIVVDRPEDKNCSDMKSSDINFAGLKIDASETIKVTCKNHHE